MIDCAAVVATGMSAGTSIPRFSSRIRGLCDAHHGVHHLGFRHSPTASRRLRLATWSSHRPGAV
jgi:hypothetical protein